jgi:hypothetical protein
MKYRNNNRMGKGVMEKKDNWVSFRVSDKEKKDIAETVIRGNFNGYRDLFITLWRKFGRGAKKTVEWLNS